MRIMVFGVTGMLGNYVYNYFLRKNYNVVGVTRQMLDLTKISNIEVPLNNITKDDIVINCIELTKQVKHSNDLSFVLVNSMFPLLLSNICKNVGAKLIHISNSDVFSGNKKYPYNELEYHDSTDMYGKSKSIGEPKNDTVIRTSVIGEEFFSPLYFLELIKSKENTEITGRTTYFWNGITCLQFAEICDYIINNNMFWKGVKHIFSPNIYSEFELIQLISEVYSLNIKIVPYDKGFIYNKSLESIRNDILIEVPDLKIQLIKMRKFFN